MSYFNVDKCFYHPPLPFRFTSHPRHKQQGARITRGRGESLTHSVMFPAVYIFSPPQCNDAQHSLLYTRNMSATELSGWIISKHLRWQLEAYTLHHQCDVIYFCKLTIIMSFRLEFNHNFLCLPRRYSHLVFPLIFPQKLLFFRRTGLSFLFKPSSINICNSFKSPFVVFLLLFIHRPVSCPTLQSVNFAISYFTSSHT